MAQSSKTPQFNTLTDYMRYITGGLTSRIGRWVASWGVSPDLITLTGLLSVTIAAIVIAQGEFFWGAVIIIVGAPLDAIDGAVARAMGRKGRFGALWDSTLDRYADGFIFLGIAYYYSTQGNHNAVVLAILAQIGTQLVSYVRARAEGLNVDCKVGLFTRMERMIIILVMLVTGLMLPGLWILAIGTNITVMQRVWHVYGVLKARDA